MRRIINYIRSCFCKHDFLAQEAHCKEVFNGRVTKQGTKVSIICKKCGYHKTFWKYQEEK